MPRPTLLEPAGRGLWTLARPLRFLGIEVGTRMTVAELDGGLWVNSPVGLDEPLQAALDELGSVRWVVAPNRFHHLFVGDFATAYPDAELACTPGLAKKRSDIDWSHQVQAQASWGEIEGLRIAGMPMLDELIFFHRASRSLIATDLLMNAQPTGHFFTDQLLKLDGVATGEPEVSRLFRALAIRDRGALLDSVEQLLAWDFDRLVLCHGQNVETGAKDLVARALARLER